MTKMTKMKNLFKTILLIICLLSMTTIHSQIIKDRTLKPSSNIKIVKPMVATSTLKLDSTKRNPQIYKLSKIDTKRFSKIKKVTPIYTPNTSGSAARQGVDLESVVEDIEYHLGETIAEKLNIFRYIYTDKNKNSNFYYYLPSTYTLKWDKRNGKYAFNIFYLSSEIGEKGSVLLKMELVSKITKKDLSMAERMLSKELRKTVKLLPMPVQGISADFGSSLTNFEVKPESVHVNATSDYMKPIVIDWKMESNVDDFISAMLNNIGLNANMEYLLPGDLNLVTTVPIDLQVNDPITFGKLEIENIASAFQNGWVNYLDYPVILSDLILVRKYGNGNLTTLKTPISDVEIQPGEIYDFGDFQNQGNVTRAWFDYAIPECSPCNEKVRKKIVGGTSGSQITDLEIQILNILETSEAYMYKLNIKSKQADPNGETEVKIPSISIKEDDTNFSGGKFYVPDGKELYYQYQLIQIMPDGQTTTSLWKDGNQSFLVIGEMQLETIFSMEDASNDEQNIEAVTDSLIDKGKKIIEGLFNKKDKDTIND